LQRARDNGGRDRFCLSIVDGARTDRDPSSMECPKCHAESPIGVSQCARCGEPLSIGDSAGLRMILPVGRSWWAIASGYLALFIITAPLAVITGILAIFDIRKNPHKHGMGRAIFGIAFGGLVTGVYVIFLVAQLWSRAR
jgi:hypothetical protein